MDTNKMRDISREQFEATWADVMRGDEPPPGRKPTRSRIDPEKYAGDAAQFAWKWWQRSRATLATHGWQDMETCPQHTEVLFYRSDAGVFTGMITDADHFLSDKERDEWEGTEDEMFDLDAFGFGDWGVCRCDGSERPTHWMPIPSEPEEAP